MNPSTPAKTGKHYLRWLAYLVLATVAFSGIAIATTGFWLVPAAEEIRQADVIVVLAGAYERSEYAADLYQEGWAPKIWVSRPAREPRKSKLEKYGFVIPTEEQVHLRVLLYKKVAPENIDYFGARSLSTADEALAMREKIGAHPLRLLIVTSPTHVRRARIIFEDALKGTGTSLQVVATPYERFEPYWWRDQDSARIVILEIAKIIYYAIGGRFTSDHKIP